jgi:hypothetical protein
VERGAELREGDVSVEGQGREVAATVVLIDVQVRIF